MDGRVTREKKRLRCHRPLRGTDSSQCMPQEWSADSSRLYLDLPVNTLSLWIEIYSLDLVMTVTGCWCVNSSSLHTNAGGRNTNLGTLQYVWADYFTQPTPRLSKYMRPSLRNVLPRRRVPQRWTDDYRTCAASRCLAPYASHDWAPIPWSTERLKRRSPPTGPISAPCSAAMPGGWNVRCQHSCGMDIACAAHGNRLNIEEK